MPLKHIDIASRATPAHLIVMLLTLLIGHTRVPALNASSIGSPLAACLPLLAINRLLSLLLVANPERAWLLLEGSEASSSGRILVPKLAVDAAGCRATVAVLVVVLPAAGMASLRVQVLG